MILVCPACSTRYKIDASSLGEAGRQVKCARCGNVWHSNDQVEPAPAIDTRAAAIFSGATDTPTAEAPPPATEPSLPEPEPEPEEDRFTLPPDLKPGREIVDHISVPRKSNANRAGWALLVLTVLGVGIAGYFARDNLIAAWPPAAKLYDTLGIPYDTAAVMEKIEGQGLAIEDIVSEWTEQDGVNVLTVRGQVINRSESVRSVPTLLVWLEGDDDRQLKSWELSLNVDSLGPGETTSFETTVDEPIDNARRVEIAVLEG